MVHRDDAGEPAVPENRPEHLGTDAVELDQLSRSHRLVREAVPLDQQALLALEVLKRLRGPQVDLGGATNRANTGRTRLGDDGEHVPRASEPERHATGPRGLEELRGQGVVGHRSSITDAAPVRGADCPVAMRQVPERYTVT